MSEEVKKPDFEAIRQVDPYGNEFWSARDLMPLLGYTHWRDFDNAIRKAIISSQEAGETAQDHFADIRKMVEIGSNTKRQVKDYKLSRLGCYLTAQNGDPRKSEIAAAQLYFAVATRANELERLRADQEKRLELRERIGENNKDLSKAAFEAGVTTKGIGKFHDAGYRGLYGGLGVDAIKARKGISDKEDVLDRMGSSELAANDFRVTQTRDKLRREGISGEENATDAHRTIGKKVRGLIEEIGGTMPESLPAEPSIKPLLNEKKRNRKKTALPPGSGQGKGTTEEGGETIIQDKLFE